MRSEGMGSEEIGSKEMACTILCRGILVGSLTINRGLYSPLASQAHMVKEVRAPGGAMSHVHMRNLLSGPVARTNLLHKKASEHTASRVALVSLFHSAERVCQQLAHSLAALLRLGRVFAAAHAIREH